MMNVTIGEIANILLPYSTHMDMNIVNDHPFLRVFLNGSGYITKVYMYVVQTAEHTYAVCDSDDDQLGNKYFPTGSVVRPLMCERDIIHEWLDEKEAPKDQAVKTDISNSTFESYLLERLYYYGIIRFNPKDRDVAITSLDFRSLKIRRIVDRSFVENHYHNSNIGNLIDLVMKKQKTINFPQLKEKEIKCIYSKLRDKGLEVTFKDCEVIRVEYIRR